MFFDSYAIDSILEKSHFNLEKDIKKNASLFLLEMERGIVKKDGMPSSLAMLSTHLCPFCVDKERLRKIKTIVIDLGGTNLRSAIATFDEYGNISISDVKVSTIFTGEEYEDANVFFCALASHVDYLKNKADQISFCFSYAIDFIDAGKAMVKSLSKDFIVPNIEGLNIGFEFKNALISNGWMSSVDVFVLNDTVAALYAGIYKQDFLFSSYVSFVLGTGLNAAYLEEKEDDVLILEAGAFDKIPMSDFDRQVIEQSKEGYHHKLEKMCSSHYLGYIAYEMIKMLANSDVFSNVFSRFILDKKAIDTNKLWEKFNGFLLQSENDNFFINDYSIATTKRDFQNIAYVLNLLIERTANLSTSLISACCIKNRNRNNKDKPISVVIEGSTIIKTHRLLSKIRSNLKVYLEDECGIYFELKNIEHATLIGSAIVALTNSNLYI